MFECPLTKSERRFRNRQRALYADVLRGGAIEVQSEFPEAFYGTFVNRYRRAQRA